MVATDIAEAFSLASDKVFLLCDGTVIYYSVTGILNELIT